MVPHEQAPRQSAEQAISDAGSVVSQVGREMRPQAVRPPPPSYPRAEAYLYERGAPAPAFQTTELRQLAGNVSALPLDISRVEDFPGLDQQAQEAVRGHLGDTTQLVPIQNHATDRMRRLMEARPDMFSPVDGFTLATGERIQMGSPLRFNDGYTGIPLYITQGGRTQFVMAYRSGSQGCWRRYAGADYNEDVQGGLRVAYAHYYKGGTEGLGMEDWQNFDHRIQRRLDSVFSSRPAIDAKVNVTAFGVRGFADNERLLVANEEAVQHSMANGVRTWDAMDEGNRPNLSRVVSNWTATGNPIYGSQLNAVVESQDGRFRYGVSLTRFGLFVQYVEDNTQRGINSVGAPSRGVRLADGSSWVLAPIVEYAQQVDIGKPGIRYRRDPGIPSYRRVFTNLHTEDSPFRTLSRANRALSGVYEALEAGDAALAQQRFQQWRQLPPDQRFREQ
jgi:hypothetical protein